MTPRISKVVKIIPKGQWADSSVHDAPDHASQSAAERVQRAREFYRKLYWWMSGGKELPRRMERVVRFFRHSS